MRRNVFLPGEPLPDDGDDYVDVPKGNDRMWKIELRQHGRSRGIGGTATIYRLAAFFSGLKQRYPECTVTPRGKTPIVVRRRRGGAIIAVIDVLEGPVASVASRH